jgi:hypothetical protein
MRSAALGLVGSLALFGASFFMYGGPLLVALAEGTSWYVSASYVAFHAVPGSLVSGIAIAQIVFGVSRASAIASMAGGALMAFGPGLGPLIGILHFHVGFVAFAVAYHAIPGAIAFAIGMTQLRAVRGVQPAS